MNRDLLNRDLRPPRRRRLLGTAGTVIVLLATGACSGSDAEDAATRPTATGAGAVTTAAITTVTADGSTAATTTVGPSTSGPGTSADVPSTTAAPPATATGATVPVATVAPQAPTPIGTPASDGGGVEFAIASVTAVEGEASGPGEIGGPAVQVTVTATNRSTAPVDLSLALVDLRHGAEQVPASPLSIGSTPFSGGIAAGATTTAVYVFAVPLDQRSAVRIYVSARPDLPAVVFEGPVA